MDFNISIKDVFLHFLLQYINKKKEKYNNTHNPTLTHFLKKLKNCIEYTRKIAPSPYFLAAIQFFFFFLRME